MSDELGEISPAFEDFRQVIVIIFSPSVASRAQRETALGKNPLVEAITGQLADYPVTVELSSEQTGEFARVCSETLAYVIPKGPHAVRETLRAIRACFEQEIQC